MKRLSTTTKNALRQVRHVRVRAHVKGTADQPRLSVFRGLRSTVAQLVDDVDMKTLVYVHSREVKPEKSADAKAKVAVGLAVGKMVASKAAKLGITKAVFDRGGYKYHGRVKAVAEGARAGGLAF